MIRIESISLNFGVLFSGIILSDFLALIISFRFVASIFVGFWVIVAVICSVFIILRVFGMLFVSTISIFFVFSAFAIV